MHQLRCLALDRTDQPLVRMAEAIDRNTGSEVQITAAIFIYQMTVISANRPKGGPRINGHQRSNGHGEVSLHRKIETEKRKRQMAAPSQR